MSVEGIFRIDKRHSAVFFLLLALCWLSYGGNAGHQLLHWDDITYVSANPWVTNPSWTGLKELFTEVRLLNWHPLTWLSYIPEYQLCGTRAACYKATNITLHAVNAFLVYWLCGLLLSLTLANAATVPQKIKRASLIAAALFAVHTQHVESVIWVAERKDLLCAVFFLLAMICYLRQHTTATPRRTYLPFLFFALAALSKSMAVTLPAALIILDFHPLDRFKGKSARTVFQIAIVEKLHYHLTALVLVLVTLLSQGVDAIEQPSLLQRALIATSALRHYVTSFVWPWDLTPFYPVEIVRDGSGPGALVLLAGTLLAILASAVVGGRRAVAFLAYLLVTLAPVIGVVKVGEQAFADRYTYLPMVGFYVIAGFAITAIPLPGARRRAASWGLAVALLLLLGLNTHKYKDVWRSDLALWQYVEARYPDRSATVHINLGSSHFEQGLYQQAIAEYRRGLEVNPRRSDLHYNLGRTYEKLGDDEKALRAYAGAVENNPEDVWAYVEVAEAHERHGKYDAAIRYYTAALQRDSSNEYALFGLGKVLLVLGDVPGSIAILELLPPASPLRLDAQLLLAQAYLRRDKQRASQILEQIERRYGKSKEVDSIRAMLN